MNQVFAYAIEATLHEGAGTVLYRATRRDDGRRVILKTLRPRARAGDVERLKRELDISRTLELPTVVKVVGLDTYRGMPALVMEDFGGESLDNFVGSPMPAARFLELALGVTRAVADIHRLGVVHKDLKPANVIVDPRTGEVKIADFGIASRVPREEQLATSVRLIEGSLAYMAPEQTGRMNRGIDARADLYSLGVLFYELLTGRLPFQATDPLEWVHCHIARSPQPPSAGDASIPCVLSDITMRLLAKLPEQRYQSAAGLVHDLERAASLLDDDGHIAPFSLGARDASDRLQIARELYGRERETATLLAAFDRVVTTGAPELLLVSGYSGIGKTALVSELHEPIVRSRGVFLRGKFDQHKRDIPYATFAEALRQLVQELLGSSEEDVELWRGRLTAALGKSGRLVTDMIPEAERIVGPQPPVVELSASDARVRFNETFRLFLGVFAAEAHPVVLFFDDLQWADAGSLDLLTHVLTHEATRHLFAVGAYRDNEVSPSHRLVRAVDAMRVAGARVADVVLAPLGVGDVSRLVEDTLHYDAEAAAPLAALVHQKTGGNPFFAVQLLAELHREGLIAWDGAAWCVDVERIRAKGYTDNVVDLMAQKLRRFPAFTQEVLKLAACAGNVVEGRVLATISERTEDELVRDLWDALREGVLLRVGEHYRFAHDRVQQAAYSFLLPDQRQEAVHLRIGRLLLANVAPADLDRRVFDIVHQLNLGASRMDARAEREALARLDLVAGKRAKAQTAYAAAIAYLEAGIGALDEDAWERLYELAFPLHLELAENESLVGNFDRAGELLGDLKRRARSVVDRAAVYRIAVGAALTSGEIVRAVDVALEGLRLFGIEMSPHPSLEEVEAIHRQVMARMGDRRIEDLAHLPSMTDPEMVAAMQLLAVLMAPAYFTDNNLFFLHLAHMVNLSLRYGNTEASVSGYSWFGVGLTTIFRRYGDGFRFGKLGYELMERGEHLAYRADANMVMEILSYWNRPMGEMIAYVRASFEAAAETGNRPIAGYACNHLVMDLLDCGEPLDEVYRESLTRFDWAKKASYRDICDIIVGIQRYVQNMRGLTDDFSTFRGPDFDEAAFEAELTKGRMATLRCWHDLMKMMARFMSGDLDEAIAAGERAMGLVWSSLGLVQFHDLHFYFALVCAARYDVASAEEQARYREVINSHRTQLGEWAANCAANFLPTHALVSAEAERIAGNVPAAMDLYETAIRAAREGGFVQIEGLAYELAAAFYRRRGFTAFGEAYLREARACYRRWGAAGKVRQLEQRFPQLVEQGAFAAHTTFAARPEQLDLLSVVKASQTISGEIVWSDLVRTLLEVVVTQGGAQRGLLISCRDGDLCVEAEAEAALGDAGVRTQILPSAPVTTSTLVPVSIVNYVRRTGERVILGDTTESHRFSGDPYFARARPRSVLCLPIVRQGQVVGMIALENDLVAGAFTVERLAVLELLAAQAAISLQNALFVAREHAARADAEQARGRAAFLARVSAELGESLDEEQPAPRIARVLVDFPADWCTLELGDDREAPRRILGVHVDPERQALLDHVCQRHGAPLAARVGASVVTAGSPVVVGGITRENCADDEHLRSLQQLGAASLVGVALSARGRAFGALVFGRGERHRPFDAADLVVASELAHRIGTAMDNASLYRQTQQAVRVREDFLSVASHELRTPMTSLALSLSMLLQTVSAGKTVEAPSMKRLLLLTKRQSDRVERLIGDLLDATRAGREEFPLDPVNVDLGALVREVAARFEPDLQRAGCTLGLHEPGGVVGTWDRSRLDQVVGNLLSNAMKFGEGKPIDMRVEADAATARLVVKDHGIGIALERQPHIFDRFERAVSAQHYGGLGLGLYISRRIVEAHGGSIRVTSKPGEGATFHVEVPLAGPPSSATWGKA